ncbi:immune inhibitor A [candidate division KSB1 bacterium]|nr:immune inhibitor A [candidate division KSB1 bacterium]
MKLVCTIALALACMTSVFAEIQGPADVRHHSLIRVWGKTPAHEKAIFKNVGLDFMPGPQPGNVQIAAFPEDLTWLAEHGYNWELIHTDLEEFYVRRARDEGNLDLMGGYRTYAEIVTFLNTLHATYPTITTAPMDIGRSLGDSVLWAMKISDNPDVDENEPEVFYNSLIHAREPAAMEAVLLFMQNLCQNYTNNVQPWRDMVETRELWFVPCVNPDGYAYNQSTNPNGGGMWRKNRRNNGDGSYGIDLNRNWSYLWGYDNVGSSPTPNSETYRGPSPASEPETQVMSSFFNERNFIIAINNHTYSNLLLKPWGTSTYQGGYTPENATYDVIIDSMQYFIQQSSGEVFATGTAWELLYNTNGDCNDWCYGDISQRARVFGVTPEIGTSSDGFWPAPSRIPTLTTEMQTAYLFVARLAGSLTPPDQWIKKTTHQQTELGGNGNAVVDPGEQFSLSVTLKNEGALDIDGLVGTLSTADPNVTVLTNSSTWPTLTPAQSSTGATLFVIQVSGDAPSSYGLTFDLTLSASTGLDTVVNVGAVIGTPVFVDDMEGGTNGWTTEGTGTLWHLSTRRAESPSHSWYSGNEGTGLYDDNMNASLVSPAVILSNGSMLNFWHYYSLETDYDYGFVEINAGNGWEVIGGPYNGSSGWTYESISLVAYPAGATAQIRFRMYTDAGVTQEGWYVDDVQLAPPGNIMVSPLALDFGLLPGEIETQPVVVQNSGFNAISYNTGFGSGATLDTSAADAYGYRWQDANGPCGPPFEWLNLSAAGVQLTFATGDQVLGPYVLPFDFPFYGEMYNRFWVSANGWISFADSATALAVNVPLPGSTAPAAAIFGWWDDLKPQLAGTNVRYWNNGVDSAAVLYENVRAGTAPNQGTYNFEILLTPGGESKVIFGSMGTIRLNSATVGIQNAAKTVGLMAIHNNATPVGDNQVRRFAMGPRYVDVLPVAGTLAGGESDTLYVRVVGDLLCSDPSLTALQVRSNDPDSPVITIAITAGGAAEPGVPINVTALRIGDDIELRWVASAGATGYRIERATELDGVYTPIDTVIGTTYTDLGAAIGAQQAFYHVIATN